MARIGENMTAKEYELFTKHDIEKRLKATFGKEIEVKHLQKLKSPDGIEHEVDLHYYFEVDGIKYLNIVECKQWNKSVTREMVKAFKAVKDDLRAHKAVMITNHGYQSGAIEYAKVHGIGLVKLNKRERDVWAHFDGGLATVESLLKSDSSENIKIGQEVELVGLFSPDNETFAQYLANKFGREFALFLIDEGSLIFDMDDMNSPLPNVFVKAVENLPDNWHKDYDILETGGLNFHLDTAPFFRIFNMKITILKMHIQSRNLGS
jgi:hypothetical protein